MIAWLRRIFARDARRPSALLPAELTDVIGPPLRGSLAPADLVDFMIAAALGGTRKDEIERGLMERFGISPADAALVRDRTFGGIFRAGTRSHENRPDRAKDAIAWASYERANRDKSIIKRLFPEFNGRR